MFVHGYDRVAAPRAREDEEERVQCISSVLMWANLLSWPLGWWHEMGQRAIFPSSLFLNSFLFIHLYFFFSSSISHFFLLFPHPCPSSYIFFAFCYYFSQTLVKVQLLGCEWGSATRWPEFESQLRYFLAVKPIQAWYLTPLCFHFLTPEMQVNPTVSVSWWY